MNFDNPPDALQVPVEDRTIFDERKASTGALGAVATRSCCRNVLRSRRFVARKILISICPKVFSSDPDSSLDGFGVTNLRADQNGIKYSLSHRFETMRKSIAYCEPRTKR